MKNIRAKQSGFSLVELMVVAAVFIVITGAVFALLIATEQRDKMESELLNSFNGANVAIDQMTRDIHQAGFPPGNTYTTAAIAGNKLLQTVPFAWRGVMGYPNATCTMGAGGSCGTLPGSYDIILELNPDPSAAGSTVDWIRYQLPAGSHTLMRAVTPKVNGGPDGQTSPFLVPYLDGVMNNASPAEIATIQTYYPSMFPGNVDVPVFTYYCDSPAGTVACTTANSPLDIREVQITLIVEAATPDLRTRQPRIVTLTGEAERINPNK